jgi:hypothetical protein
MSMANPLLHGSWSDSYRRQTALTCVRQSDRQAASGLDADRLQHFQGCVHFLLTQQPDGRTLLRLVHDGWAAFSEDQRASLIESHIDGWTYHLRSLMGYFLRQEGLL